MRLRCRRPSILTSVVALAALALLAAGCGGGGSSGVASVASSTTTAVATTAQQGTTTTRTGTLASAFDFARCMRSHGIPGWPDPNSQGFFDKSKLRPLGLGVSRVRALEEGPCNIPLPSPQGQTVAITRADQAYYVEGAACMRSHGVPGFPDPTFEDNGVTFDLPSSINRESSTFKRAQAICTKRIPAGLPDSTASAP
jgi:hypothetical protein